MSSALIIAVGSRGDTEPLIALATAMLRSPTFSKVHLCIQLDYLSLVPDVPGIVTHELPFQSIDFRPYFKWEALKAAFFSLFTGNLDPIPAQLRGLAKLIAGLIVPVTPTLFDIASNVQPSIVLATSLAAPVGVTLGEALRIPVSLVHFQPNTKTDAFPCYMHGTESAVRASEYVAKGVSSSTSTHHQFAKSWNAQDEMHYPSLAVLNPIRAKLGLPSFERSDLSQIFNGQRQHLHVLHSYPTQLVFKAPDWGPNVHVVPPLADDYMPPGWDPAKNAPELFKYLSSGEKPLCVTFGSMVMDRQEFISVQLLSALRSAGVDRVVILKGRTDFGPHHLNAAHDELKRWADEHVLVTSECPQYAWFIPRCSAVLCHGGAGTMSAVLRSGVPVIVAPVLCDQFFWGNLVHQLRLGAVVAPSLRNADASSFRAAFEIALSPEIFRRAAEYGKTERLRQSGSSMAAEILASIITESRD